MRLKNPLTFEFSHPNFGAGKTEVSLNQNETIGGYLDLDVKAPDGRMGTATIQCQDNGNVVIRVHLSPENPIHVLIVDGGGTLLEQ